MDRRCARCETSEPRRKMYPPGEWVEYLVSTREMESPDGVLAIPLCAACHDRLVSLRTGFRQSIDATSTQTLPLWARIEQELDALVMDHLLDEGAPVSPREQRFV